MRTSLLIIAPIIALIFASAKASAQTIIGLTESDELFTIADVSVPSSTTTPVAITGVTAGQSIVGMDYRPATGELFAMGYNYADGAAQLYKIDPTTAVATAVNTTPVTLSLGFGSIGFDFNPTVDRIRIVGATSKKNYRLNPVNGSIAATDGDLAYNALDVNRAASPSIGAVAYTNSYIGAESTALYDYDESLNVIALQNPPNNGTLNTVGASGVSINTNNRTVDMDIWFDPVSRVNRAYLVANTGPGSIDGLFSVNLTTGASSLIGSIGLPVKDIAIVIDRTLPFLSGQLIYGLSRTNRNLVSFTSIRPDVLRTSMPLTGITAGQTLVGLDFRPADGTLYGLGYNPATRQYQVYTVNTDSSTLTAVNGTSDTMNLGLNLDMIGFDFNPMVDRIRVVSGSTRANYRLNPETGAIAAIDSLLHWAPGDTNAAQRIRIGSIAYTNSYKGATTTQLYGYSDSISSFVLINPPNNGTLNTRLKTSIPLHPSDVSTDMDFFYDSVTASNIGYFIANPPGTNNDLLYTFTASGTISIINSIGSGIAVVDIAVKPAFTNSSQGVGVPQTHSTATAQPFLYPNPAIEILRVALPTALGEGGQYEVRDITGRILLQDGWPSGAKQADISLRSVASGTYFLHIHSNGNAYAPAQFIKL